MQNLDSELIKACYEESTNSELTKRLDAMDSVETLKSFIQEANVQIRESMSEQAFSVHTLEVKDVLDSNEYISYEVEPSRSVFVSGSCTTIPLNPLFLLAIKNKNPTLCDLYLRGIRECSKSELNNLRKIHTQGIFNKDKIQSLMTLQDRDVSGVSVDLNGTLPSCKEAFQSLCNRNVDEKPDVLIITRSDLKSISEKAVDESGVSLKDYLEKELKLTLIGNEFLYDTQKGFLVKKSLVHVWCQLTPIIEGIEDNSYPNPAAKILIHENTTGLISQKPHSVIEFTLIPVAEKSEWRATSPRFRR